MIPVWWQRAKQYFVEWESLTASQRESLLRRLMAEEPEVSRALERLLANADERTGPLDQPAFALIQSCLDFSLSGSEALLSAPPKEDTFPTSERFRVIRKLGSGGMGAVFEVFDNVLSARVAAKTLRRASPVGISLFKHEFRNLANIHHPNLVTLYEFFSQENTWFYTMDLVIGIDPLLYVHRLSTDTISEERIRLVRQLSRQLCRGIAAIHAAGKLHRDIKPRNILVTEAGRVVLLDFGLVRDTSSPDDAHLAGTASWMSPEQAKGTPLSTSSDWYAFGVVLYELLTGTLPPAAHSRLWGDPDTSQPVAPADMSPVPEELSALCMSLLELPAERRPTEQEILTCLGEPAEDEPLHLLSRSHETLSYLVGREAEVSALHRAYQQLEKGESVSVLIDGQPGIGKSALVHHFLNQVAEGPSVVVVRGRCYERESVPFNALDSMIDDLAPQLREHLRSALQELNSIDVAALCRVFPVLQWLDRTPREQTRSIDGLELQSRAFRALREIFVRLGRMKRVVCFIDDLHWGDVDSAFAIRELLLQPGAPTLLLIMTARPEEPYRSPCLQQLLDGAEGTTLEHRVEIHLSALPPSSAAELAGSLMAQSHPTEDVRELAESIARESGGNPFFISEIAQYAAGQTSPGSSLPRLSLQAIMSERVQRLPLPARRLIETVALAFQPLRSIDAISATAADDKSLNWIALLHANHFLRAPANSSFEYVEPFHDRVREVVIANIPVAAQREGHIRLAHTLEQSGHAGPETLALHFEHGGEMEVAGGYFEKAGRSAARALAFNRAARLFTRALELAKFTEPQQAEVTRELASSLANAGHGREAADVYARVAHEPTLEGLLSLSRSGYHYAASGHVDEGKRAFALVLRQVRLRLPLHPALASFLLMPVRLRLTGRRLQRSLPQRTPTTALQLARIDACWMIGTGLGLVELSTGALFTSYALHLALKAGEPFRIARSLSWEAAIRASQSKKGKTAAQGLFAVCRERVLQTMDPAPAAMLALTEGQAYFSNGRWTEALSSFEEARKLFENRCTGVAFELATLQGFKLQTLVYLGEYNALRTLTPELLDAARIHRDRYLETFIRGTIQPLLLLADDKPDQARESILRALSDWPARGYHLQHALVAQVRVAVELYGGENTSAAAYLRTEWPHIRRSYLLLNQNLRAKLLEARVRCALADARSGRGDNPERMIRRLAAEEEPYMTGCVLAFQAVIAKRDNKLMEAEDLFRSAIGSLEKWGMRDHAASAYFALAKLASPRTVEPPTEVSWFTEQKIHNPARWTKMRFPEPIA